VILNTKDLIRSLLSNEITIILMMVAFSHGLDPQRSFASVDSNAGQCPRPCGNSDAARGNATLERLIKTETKY
jgi:hypothetical protein